jgi:hypothetical protein
MNETLKNLTNKINALQLLIDAETEAAEAGSIISQQRIINAELEKEQVSDAIDQIAINLQII